MSISYRVLDSADEPFLLAFIRGLSAETKLKRFLTTQHICSSRFVERLLKADCSLAAIEDEPGAEKIIGLGNLQDLGEQTCEIALVVSDNYQRQGIGSHIAQELANYARTTGYRRIYADVDAKNNQSLSFLKKLVGTGDMSVTNPGEGAMLSVEINFQ